MIELIYKLIICHLIGDYVLQIDFIAKTKGDNFYHLLVHCFLYTVPFYLYFGFDVRLIVLLISHIIIDVQKAKFKAISYTRDQILHYFMCIMYLF